MTARAPKIFYFWGYFSIDIWIKVCYTIITKRKGELRNGYKVFCAWSAQF